MATKKVKVKAYKKLSPTGKIQSVDAHLREIEGKAKKLSQITLTDKNVESKIERAFNNVGGFSMENTPKVRGAVREYASSLVKKFNANKKPHNGETLYDKLKREGAFNIDYNKPI